MPKLCIPTVDVCPSYVEALREGHISGDSKPMPPDEIEKIDRDHAGFIMDFSVPKTGKIKYPNGDMIERVPQDTLWFCDGKKFIGNANIRRHLNWHLERFGGHIGYGVRPGCRGQGMATEILRQAREYCARELGIQKALVTCNDANKASARVIEKNGGELIDVAPNQLDPAGTLLRRYWVPCVAQDIRKVAP